MFNFADPPVASSPAADQGPATTAETSVGDGNEVAKTDSADNDSHVHPVAGLHSDSNIEAQTHSSPQSPSSETDNPPSERNSTGDTEAVNTTENGIVDGGGEHGDVEKVEKPESTSQEVNADEATQGVQRTKSSSSSRDNLPEAEAASNAPTASASSADTTERSDPLNDTGSRKRVQVAGAASVTDQPASLPSEFITSLIFLQLLSLNTIPWYVCHASSLIWNTVLFPIFKALHFLHLP